MTVVVDAARAVMNLPRRDARDKLAGRTRYTTDMAGPGTLQAAVRRSDVASGRIIRIDTGVARQVHHSLGGIHDQGHAAALRPSATESSASTSRS